MSNKEKSLFSTFLSRWIYANILGYGAAWLAAQLTSNQVFVVLQLCLFTGIAQSIACRHLFKSKYDWLLAKILTAITLIISFLAFPYLEVYLPILFPLVSALFQCWALRKDLNNSINWLPRYLLAHISGWLTASICILPFSLLLFHPNFSQQSNIFIAITSMLYLCISRTVFSLITALGFKPLFEVEQKENSYSKDETTQKDLDIPPENPTWITKFLVPGLSWAIWILWYIYSQNMLPHSEVYQTYVYSSFFSFQTLAIALIYNYFAIFVHELGHLACALLCGFKFHYLSVSRILCVQKNSGIRFRVFKRLAAGGITSTIPQNRMPSLTLRRKISIMVAGGPIASFLLFFCGAILLYFPHLYLIIPYLWSITILSGISLSMAVINSIPIKFGHFRSDGYLFLELSRGTTFSRYFVGIYQYLTEDHIGIRPQEISSSISEDLSLAPEKTMFELNSIMINYFMSLDSLDYDKAGMYIEKAYEIKEYYPEFYRSELLLESAYYYAVFRHESETAVQRFEEIVDLSLIEGETILRVEAALDLVQGKFEAALEKSKKGQKLIQSYPRKTGRTIAEIDWLRDIEERAILARS